MSGAATETRQLAIRIQAASYETIKGLADANKRSITKQIEWLIEQAAAQAGAEPVAAQPEAAAPA